MTLSIKLNTVHLNEITTVGRAAPIDGKSVVDVLFIEICVAIRKE